ncbi:hypothetical protein VTN77DRAFT_9408 [Rasamsonia byssochlamydoides]|uniref:uncharacterized protein n=1 Tax=Rasamsonia byssochlamydoides TaxID=89139 RepID=UPI0037425FE1
MFPNPQHGQQQLSPMTYPQSPWTSAESHRSRHNSDAMTIYSVTNRDEGQQGRPEHHGSNSASPTTGTSSITTGPAPINLLSDHYPDYEENGRMFHGFRKGVYMYPCDEQEQDRLDIFHKVITEARVGNELIRAPLYPNSRVLDLGCGTGIWAIDVANQFPNAFVLGVDLSPIQPKNIPKNCDFYAPWDYECPWTSLGENYWDLIHLQMGAGSVASWPSLYRRIFDNLRPGGWFEQVEIDFEPRCDDRSLENTNLMRWYQSLRRATEQAMRPIAHNYRETIDRLKAAGFVDVQHQMVGLPLNPWHRDEHERTVGRWYNLAISESVETLSLGPLHRIFGWSLEQIKGLAASVKLEAFNKEIHAYNVLHIYQARRPSPKN